MLFTNKNNKFIFIALASLAVLAAIVGIIVLIIFLVKRNQAPTESIKRYLTDVYPAVSFSGVSDNDVRELYNNLGWYYQCCNTPNSYIDNEGRLVTNTVEPKSPDNASSPIQNWPILNWKAIGCCSDKPIPLLPEGIYYDWYSWQYFGVPIITIRDGKWGYADFTNNGVKFADPTNTRGGIDSFVSQPVSNFPSTNNFNTSRGPTNVSNGTKPGPSCFYAGSRNLVKYPYYPYGLQYTNGSWTLNGHQITDHDYMFAHTLSSSEMRKNMMYALGQDGKTYWIDGYPKGSHIEVGHVGHSPTGLPDSTGFWINHFPPRGGTGVFYEVGRCPVMLNPEGGLEGVEGHAPRNKVALLLTLLFEISQSTELPNVGCKLADKDNKRQYFTNGKELLEHLYGTSDPYQIVFYHCVGYYDDILKKEGTWTRRPLQSYAMSSNGYSFCDTPMWAAKNSFLPEGTVGNAFAKSGVFYKGNNQLSYINNLSYQVYCYHVLLTYFNGSIPDDMLDSPKGYVNYFTSGGETPVFYANNVVRLSRKGRKYVIDLACQSNWYFDRVADGVAFDEPMHYFGNILGYESLQMTADPTANGLWGYEIIDIRWPEDHLPQFFKTNGNKSYPAEWSGWKKLALKDRQWALAWWDNSSKSSVIPVSVSTGYVAMLTNVFITQRNPFRPDDDEGVLSCSSSGGFKCNSEEVQCKTLGNPLTTYRTTQGVDLNSFLSPAQCDTNDTKSLQSYFNLEEQHHPPSKEKRSFNLAVQDTKNNLCYPIWANNIQMGYESDGLSTANTFGQMYCQSANTFPYSAFWGNVDYNTGTARPNNNPNIGVSSTLPYASFN